jgi:hypothetical protein
MTSQTKTESQEQIDLIQWCKRNQKKYPELKNIFAIPNGGKRHIATASRMKLEGVKSGVPDLFLAVAKRGYNGLFIEMKKAKGGSVSKSQKEWKNLLEKAGYAWIVGKGFTMQEGF